MHQDLILTHSTVDRSVCLWMNGKPDPVLCIRNKREILSSHAHASQTIGVSAGSSAGTGFVQGGGGHSNAFKSNEAQIFPCELVDASFFHQDRFLAVSTKKSLNLFKYDLSDYAERFNDLKRLGAQGKYKRIFNYFGTNGGINSESVPETINNNNNNNNALNASAVSYTAMGCANSYLSHLILLAGSCASSFSMTSSSSSSSSSSFSASSASNTSGSNKFIEVIDLNKGVICKRYNDCHARNIHQLVTYEATHIPSTHSDTTDNSISNQLSFDPRNVFLSSASDSSISLWDLRTSDPVQHFNKHINRIHAIGCCFSPCMRYIATGSEDKSALIYDLRMGGSLLQRIRVLGAQADVISDVAFHPSNGSIFLSSFNGSVLCYSQ
jgi:WD40 repeat protein